MKRLLFSVLVGWSSLNATTMDELFSSLQKQPVSQMDNLNAKMANVSQKKVVSGYYPTIDLFASYAHYNSPSSLKPIDPIETGKLIAKGEPIPFSTTIEKVGVKFSMPLFMRELSSLSKKAKYLAKSAKIKKKINFYQNEALLLGANASLEYLDNLLVAMHSTQKSLQNTKKDIVISVNSGRMAGIELDKINEKLNQLEISINDVSIKRLNLVSQIAQLTDITLKHSVSMELVADVDKNDFILLKPLRSSLKASSCDLEASKQKRYYPKAFLNGVYTRSYAQDNPQDSRDLEEDFGYYEVVLSVPLFNKKDSVDVELKKVALLKSKMNLNKVEQELKYQVKAIEDELVLLKKSKKLNKKNIANKQNLLDYAKVSFTEGRMTQEDYLRYEDDLLDAKSAYFNIVSKIWQDMGKLAVMYGVDLKEIVR